MKERWMTSCKGVTLLELMVAMGLSMLILGVATTLFKNSMDASNRGLSQIEMQQNLRTALNAVARDVSIAGVGGFPRAGIALAQASPVKYGCDNVGPTCPPFTGGTYTNGTLYPINVFNGEGPKILGNALAKNTDVIVTVSVDATFCRATPVATDVTAFTVTLPALKPTNCTSGALTAATGDVFMLSSSTGSVVAAVTAVNAASTVLTFGDDSAALNMNQHAAAANTIKTLLPSGGTGLTATRLNVITYYMSFTAPTLMRQVNANSPVPLAENVENLQFTYDLYATDIGGKGVITLGATSLDPKAIPAQDSTQIRKVNINVTARSRFPDSTGQFRRATLTTFVSPRSLSFFDRYAN